MYKFEVQQERCRMRNFLYDLLSYLSNMKEEMLLKHLDIKLFLTYYDIIT